MYPGSWCRVVSETVALRERSLLRSMRGLTRSRTLAFVLECRSPSSNLPETYWVSRMANSGEFAEDCPHKVIDFMPDQYGDIPKGGTMRLGAYPCTIAKGTILERAYGTTFTSERHRHRYEFNNEYREKMEEAGLKIAGTSPDGRLVEAVELPQHPHYVGVQYHPEFKSRPNKAHPLFREFIAAALKQK